MLQITRCQLLQIQYLQVRDEIILRSLLHVLNWCIQDWQNVRSQPIEAFLGTPGLNTTPDSRNQVQ